MLCAYFLTVVLNADIVARQTRSEKKPGVRFSFANICIAINCGDNFPDIRLIKTAAFYIPDQLRIARNIPSCIKCQLFFVIVAYMHLVVRYVVLRIFQLYRRSAGFGYEKSSLTGI